MFFVPCRFRIDADNGYITSSVTLDRESTEQFYLTVVVQDRGEPSMWGKNHTLSLHYYLVVHA